MARYGMLIDTTKCIGCYACRIACQNRNHLPADVSLIKFHEFERGAQPCVSVEICLPSACIAKTRRASRCARRGHVHRS